jgi:hypothetical protein
MTDNMSVEACEVDNQSLNEPMLFAGRCDTHVIELPEDIPTVMLVSKKEV